MTARIKNHRFIDFAGSKIVKTKNRLTWLGLISNFLSLYSKIEFDDGCFTKEGDLDKFYVTNSLTDRPTLRDFRIFEQYLINNVKIFRVRNEHNYDATGKIVLVVHFLI